MTREEIIYPTRKVYQKPEVSEIESPYTVVGLPDRFTCVVAGLAPTYEAAMTLLRTVFEVYPGGAALFHCGRAIEIHRKVD